MTPNCFDYQSSKNSMVANKNVPKQYTKKRHRDILSRVCYRLSYKPVFDSWMMLSVLTDYQNDLAAVCSMMGLCAFSMNYQNTTKKIYN